MDPNTLVMKLLAGGILGMVGQVIRVIAGLKKVHDSAQQTGRTMADEFKASTLVVSLIIGFTAGVLGAITLEMPEEDLIDKNSMLALLGIGYAGTDFIEAFMRKYPLPTAG